jgi:beta-lactamase class A
MNRHTPETGVAPAVTRAAYVLESAGLSGSLLVRHIGSGRELSLNPETPFPLASLAKLPLAAAALDAARRGELDLAHEVTIDHRSRSRGGPGIARFKHPTTVAVEDLIRVAIEHSDNSAADAVFRLVPPSAVTAWLHRVGVNGIVIRHLIEDLYESLANQTSTHDAATVHSLVVAADQHGHPSPLPELDIERANSGTARGLADLLHSLWDGSIDQEVATPVRHMLAGNLLRHRLAPDFSSDAASWSSKTGSFVHLRHEAGVVEHTDGETLIVVALTRSMIAAVDQPAAEQAMGQAARILHDELLAPT